jgi:hypothetical protein
MFNPDRAFASRNVEVMRIRDTSGVVVSECIEGYRSGDIINVPRRRGWTFLEDMGYVSIRGIPGEVITLIGVEAKLAFMTSREPDLRQIEILHDMSVSDLVAVGILSHSDYEGEDHRGFGESGEELSFKQLWRYSSYIDLDEPMRDSMMRSEYNIYELILLSGLIVPITRFYSTR